MKVIINIKNKRSQYAKFNGLTFEVAELMFGSMGVLLRQGNFNQTDFSFDEVIIVDLMEELNKTEDARSLKILLDYAQLNKIELMTKTKYLTKILNKNYDSNY